MSAAMFHRLKRFGIDPKKSLGQNFLIEEAVVYGIIEAAGVQAGDRVVEIGPGPGALTAPMLEKVGRVYAIELDERLYPLLQDIQEEYAPVGKILEVEQNDAMKVDYGKVAAHLGGKFHLVANLPYHISTPILFKLIDERFYIESMTLMFQKEVAERIVAPPGGKNYGALSVMAQLFCQGKVRLKVKPGCFYPIPKVESAVIHLTVQEEPRFPVDDLNVLRRTVHAAFSQRRKTLSNAIRQVLPEAASEALIAVGIDPMRRGETLSVEEFALLANEVGRRLPEALPEATPEEMVKVS